MDGRGVPSPAPACWRGRPRCSAPCFCCIRRSPP